MENGKYAETIFISNVECIRINVWCYLCWLLGISLRWNQKFLQNRNLMHQIEHQYLKFAWKIQKWLAIYIKSFSLTNVLQCMIMYQKFFSLEAKCNSILILQRFLILYHQSALILMHARSLKKQMLLIKQFSQLNWNICFGVVWIFGLNSKLVYRFVHPILLKVSGISTAEDGIFDGGGTRALLVLLRFATDWICGWPATWSA